MSYDVNTDYSALKKSLQQQMDATTDPTLKAQLQAQMDAAEQSKIEKIGSNLTKYGKYATDSELDSAAGIMATNQVGTGYETAKQNLNTSYDTAQQNASNSALSRGMARSSYVQDRMANIDSQRSNALANIDTEKANAIQNAKTSILNNYQTNAANQLAQDKQDYSNNIMAYYNDYAAEINNIQNDGDTSNDWKIPVLQAARNQKLLDQQAAAAAAQQQNFENGLALSKATSSGSGGGGGGGTQQTLAALDSDMMDIYKNNKDPITGELTDNGKSMMYQYAQTYGGKYAGQLLSKYGISAPASQSNTTSASLSPKAQSIATAMASARRYGTTQDQVIKSISTYVDNGTITYAEAQAIMQQLGLA